MLSNSVSDNFCAQDMHQQSSDDDLTSITELAYFEGDFWPNVIEEQIKELDQEERAQASGEVSVQTYCIVVPHKILHHCSIC